MAMLQYNQEAGMYITVSGKGASKVVQIKEDTRIPGTSKKKSKVLKTLGKYSDMLAEDPDFLQKLKAEMRQRTVEQKASRTPITVQLTSDPVLQPSDVTASYRFGHAIVQRLWSVLGLDTFFDSIVTRRNKKAIQAALFYLAAHRLSHPDSVLATTQDQYTAAGLVPVGLDVFYQVLDVLAGHKSALIEHLAAYSERNTQRERAHAFYDVTTYAFESTKWGELRLFGFSKDHKSNEVQVVMGLLIDNQGLPISYELFPGSTMDQNTLVDSVQSLKELYRLDEITVVADRGLNGKDNIVYLQKEGHHFVIGYTLKRSPEDMKALVFTDPGSWVVEQADRQTGEVLYKSRTVIQSLGVKVLLSEDEKPRTQGKRGRPIKYKTIEIPVSVHLTWSRKRALKDAADRQRVIDRLKKKLAKPSLLKAALKRGGNQYLAMDFDTDNCHLDEHKIAEAEKFDGYYAIMTDRMELSASEAVSIYKGLWKIEESFRILKTDLQARPVFVWNDDHIKGHFALCYLSLYMIRLLQHRLEQEGVSFSAEQIMEGMNSPLALVQGTYPKMVVTPTQIPQSYLEMATILGLPNLMTNMTLTQFRSATKLDLLVNLR
jgi:transposase